MRRQFLLWLMLFSLSAQAAAERFRLRHARAADLIPRLSLTHSQVKFSKCPGGLVATGTPEALRAVKRDLHHWDVPQVEEWVEVNPGDRNEVVSLLATLVPGATLELSGDYHLTVRGGRHEVAQVLELLEQLDRPLDKLTVECRVVLDTPEMQQCLGTRWVQGMRDEEPSVKHWNLYRSDRPSQAPMTGTATKADFAKGAPWVLSAYELQTLSGADQSFSVKTTGSVRGIQWNVCTSAKSDGYVIVKFLPEVNDGTNVRKFTNDARIKLGETLILAGLGRAEELGLPGAGPIWLMITVKSGW